MAVRQVMKQKKDHRQEFDHAEKSNRQGMIEHQMLDLFDLKMAHRTIELLEILLFLKTGLIQEILMMDRCQMKVSDLLMVHLVMDRLLFDQTMDLMLDFLVMDLFDLRWEIDQIQGKMCRTMDHPENLKL